MTVPALILAFCAACLAVVLVWAVIDEHRHRNPPCLRRRRSDQ